VVKKIIIALVLSAVILVGCSNGTGSEDKSAADLTNEGWQSYSVHDYQAALSKFAEAIDKDGSYADAYNGAGWANAKSDNLSAAITSFSDGVARSALLMDLRAGIAFVYNAQKNYALSNQFANQVFQTSPTWVFTHDRSISIADLRLLAAENYFALANYSESLHQVQLIEPSFGAEIATLAGQRILAQEIERLKLVI